MSSNGHHAVDIEKRTYTTGEGHVFTLRRVRALICERIANDQTGKPAVPIVRVKIGPKVERDEENPGDPDYLVKLRQWEIDRNYRLARYLFTEGVEGEPDKAFCTRMKGHFPDADEVALKYLWVVDQLPDDEIDGLMEAIMGQSEITAKGLELAADSFQRQG